VDVRIPHEVLYEVPEATAVSDIIDSLRATEQLFFELPAVLEGLVPGLEVGGVRVQVSALTQGSPLREVFFATLFLTYQTDLEKEVPALIDQITGLPVSGKYDALVTIVFCLILFYGADYLYREVVRAEGSRIRAQLDGLIKEVADRCKTEEGHVRTFLEKRYEKRRLANLIKSTAQFFTPSKRQGNAPFVIGSRRFDSDTVAEFPSDAKITDFEDEETSKNLESVEIELHAQDVDHTRQGWAGVIRQVSDRRLRMAVYPPIKPEDIYTKQRINGDVIVISRRLADGAMEPYMFHLIRLR
jgi:hypothetical protein